MAEPLVADDNATGQIDDGASDLGFDTQSDTESLRSSILEYRRENGRTYHAYKDGVYVLPNDETENERLDLQHHLQTLTLDGKIHAAPITKPLHRALDAGCGTGIWTIDFADEHPECHVVGIDLSPIQPTFVPPNVSFFVDDLEDTWTFSSNFDLIYARFMTGSIVDWPKFMEKSYEFLNPGGTIEVCDIIYPVHCDDDTVKNSALYKWSTLLSEGFAGIKRPINTAIGYKEQLEKAGFVDVVEAKCKWPSNRWPKDKKHKELGMWCLENTLMSLPAISLAIFTRRKEEGGLGWTTQELEVLLTQVRKDLKNPSIHAYWPVWSVYGRKPE